MKKERREKHGKYRLRTDNADVDRATTHYWISSSILEGEPEAFILAAQDQSISTQAFQSRILNNGVALNCRLCTQSEETVDHTVLARPTIFNVVYLQRHDRVATSNKLA